MRLATVMVEIGNVAGGVALVSALNHAQVVSDAMPEEARPEAPPEPAPATH